MFISSDPKDKVYKDLLDLAFSVCDQFVLVVRQNIILTENANTVLESLSAFLLEKREQYEWPGTKLWSERDCFGRKQKPAIVYYYRAQTQAKKVLLEATNSLYSWRQPNLPEDLSFIKNKKAWLISTSHERISYFEIDDKDEIKRIQSIKNLDIRTSESIKQNTSKEIYVNEPFNYQCVFCKSNLHEGDIAPEKWFVCMKCSINNDLAICKEDRKIFNIKTINKDNLTIEDFQTLKVAEIDLLEYINKQFINENKAGVCSKECLNLYYINKCIEHLQTYLMLAFNEKDTTSEIISIIKDNDEIQYTLMNKISELKNKKLKFKK